MFRAISQMHKKHTYYRKQADYNRTRAPGAVCAVVGCFVPWSSMEVFQVVAPEWPRIVL